jgi:hypothetical protein
VTTRSKIQQAFSFTFLKVSFLYLIQKQQGKVQGKVGREEEGSSSNRPELAAFLLALHDTLIMEPLLYLCDNRSLLKAVTRWIGEGGKATLVGSPDADILAAAIEILRKRMFFPAKK